MNFDGFKSRVKAAADLARQFQGFDELAAQDEYIHSPDLNVKRSKRPPRTAATEFTEATEPSFPVSRESFLDSLVSFSSASVSSADASFHTATGKDEMESAANTPSRVLPQEVFGTPKGGSEHSRVHRDGSDTDDEGDEHADDPVMGLIRTKRGPVGSSDVTGEVAMDHQTRGEQSRRTRNANRFMEDLDKRLSKPVVHSLSDVEQGSTLKSMEIHVDNDPSSSSHSSAKGAWNGLLQSARQTFTFGAKSELRGNGRASLTSLLTRTPLNPLTDDDNSKDEEHVTLVSSSVLGIEEQEELERLRNRVSVPRLVSALISGFQRNPRFAFIVFTFVLGYGAYLYSQQHGDEDDVP